MRESKEVKQLRSKILGMEMEISLISRDLERFESELVYNEKALMAIETNIKKYFELGEGIFDWTYFDTQVVMLTNNVAILSGYHNMFEKPPGMDPYALILRFTLVLQKINGKWLIIHNNETRVDTGPERERPVLEGEPPVPES